MLALTAEAGGKCSTAAYTAWKIFEARPAPGTQQARPPLPAMCRPSQVLLGATAAGGDRGGDFVAGGFGLWSGRGMWRGSWAPGPIPTASQKYRWLGCYGGAGEGTLQVTGGPPVGKRQPLACCGSGNVAGALTAAGAELTPQNSPPGPTCAGSSCPKRVPTCSHPVTQQGFRGPERQRDGWGCYGVERGRGVSWHVSPASRTRPQQRELQASRAARAASHSILAVTPCPLVGTSQGVQRGCPPWDLRPWMGSRVDLWLSQASQSSQLSPDNLRWPDPAPGSHPGTSRTQGPSEQPARTVSGHSVAAALASSWHPTAKGAPAPPAQGCKNIHCRVLRLGTRQVVVARTSGEGHGVQLAPVF